MSNGTLEFLPASLQDVENIVALPTEAAEAEEMLKDDSQLLQVSYATVRPFAHAYVLRYDCCCCNLHAT